MLPTLYRASALSLISFFFRQRVEKFFSKAVTHVVTTRPIPSAQSSSGSGTEARSPSKLAQPATINPSMLKRDEDVQSQSQQSKGKFNFDAALQRKNASALQLYVSHQTFVEP